MSKRRSEDEEAKKTSQWEFLANYREKIHKEGDAELAKKQRELLEDEQQRLSACFEFQAKTNGMKQQRQEHEHKQMQDMCRDQMKYEFEQRQIAKQRSLEIKTSIEAQVLQSRQRKKEERRKQVLEAEAARRECERLAAEQAAEKAAAEEKRRLEMEAVSRSLKEQSRLKAMETKANKEKEKLVVKQYQELMERQDAEREAKLQARAADQARRMAMNQGVQEAQQARDDAMDARIERHWKEKYEADDAKVKREALERQRRMQECEAQRRQQIAHGQELTKASKEEDLRCVLDLTEKRKAALAKERDDVATRKLRRKEHQQELLAQIAKCRARVPVDMSKIERDMNHASLKLAATLMA